MEYAVLGSMIVQNSSASSFWRVEEIAEKEKEMKCRDVEMYQ